MRSRTPAEIDASLRRLYGSVDWSRACGVLHVAAITDPGRVALIPGPFAPQSETDRFVLAAARARADAIVTTGAILRSEPELRHRPEQHHAETPSAGDRQGRAFEDWRRTRMGRSGPPLLIVLTASGDLPLLHPALAAAVGGFVWTTEEGAKRLRKTFGESVARLSVIARRDDEVTDIRGALGRAFGLPGVETVLVEAGPSASRPLYDRPEVRGPAHVPGASCDELLLSRYSGPVDPAAIGPAFIESADIERCFPEPSTETPVDDDSGHWMIARYRAG